MKRISAVFIATVLALMSLCSLVSCAKTSERSADTLVIYNCEDYIYPDWESEFKEYYKSLTGKDISLVYTTYDTNETMLTQVRSGAADADLICPSDYAIQKLYEEDRLLKFDWSDSSLYKNTAGINPEITSTVNALFNEKLGIKEGNFSDFLCPYMWGTLGILYNADVVTEADLAKGWGLLWNAAGNEKLNGTILMKDSIRDTYCAAVMYLKETSSLPSGYENLSVEELISCTDDVMLEAAEKVLVSQKSLLKGYEVDFGKDDMINKTAYVDLAWSGDAMYAIEEAEAENVNLDYFVPEIGGNVWFDGWVMPKTCKNQTAAQIFVDFMNSPVTAAKNMMEIGYTSAVDKDVILANSDAVAIITDCDYDTEEFFGDERRYPEITDKLGVMVDFGEKNAACVSMWERVKSGGSSLLVPILVICAVLIAAAVVIAVIIKSRAGGKRRRKV